MSDTVRERMARALYDSVPFRQGRVCITWDAVNDWGKDAQAHRLTVYDAVDAILSVLESPSDGMVHAGASSVDHPSVFMGGPSVHGIKTAGRAWRAMVAAIRRGA